MQCSGIAWLEPVPSQLSGGLSGLPGVGKRDGAIRQGSCVWENVLHMVKSVRCGSHVS